MEIINGLEMDWESVVVLQLATQLFFSDFKFILPNNNYIGV